MISDPPVILSLKKTMQISNRYPKPFKTVGIQPAFSKASLFCIHYVQVAPQSLSELGLSWGQSVGVTTLGSTTNDLVQSFVLLNQTLRKGEVILGQQVANALGYSKSGLDMILLHPHKTSTTTPKNYLYPDIGIQETNLKFSKPASPLTSSQYIYCKKQKYQLMAFIGEGTLKVQVKSYIKRNYSKSIKVLHGVDIHDSGLDDYKILNCLAHPETHNVLPEMGLLLIKPEGEEGRKLQIKLKEVPSFLSLDTEMTMNYIQTIRKEMMCKQISFDEIKTSFFKHDPDRSQEQLQLTPNTAANTNTNDGKSATRTEFSNSFYPPMLKRRKESSCDEHKAKNFSITEEVSPKVKFLENKMIKLEEQIRTLKQNQDRLTKKSEKNLIKVQEISEETNERLNAIVKQDWLAVQKVKQQMEAIHREFSQSSQCTKNMMKKSLLEMDKKLKEFSLNWSRVSSSGFNEKEQRQKESETVLIPFSPKTDKKSACVNEFQIEGIYRQVVRKKGKDAWTQLLTSQSLVYGRRSSCSIKILNSKFNFIMLGIIDRKLISNVSSWTLERSFVFMGWSGVIYANGQIVEETAQKFVVGSEIMMEVEPENGMIHWCLNDCRFSLFSKVIKREDIEWVPYIELFCNGDAVQWQ